MAAAKVKEQDFVGKEAVRPAMGRSRRPICCTLTVDDHTSASGERRYLLGREPIVLADGSAISTRRAAAPTRRPRAPARRPASTSCMAYLPPEQAVEGNTLFVEYMNERYPVTVAVVGARPLFDPENLRIRA